MRPFTTYLNKIEAIELKIEIFVSTEKCFADSNYSLVGNHLPLIFFIRIKSRVKLFIQQIQYILICALYQRSLISALISFLLYIKSQQISELNV